ncbi:MAG: hypothetical protein JXA41_11965 [Deltaproteobacteria bacterium]|nr:hypothetical protein [Deltaproteobacteria bacterium]
MKGNRVFIITIFMFFSFAAAGYALTADSLGGVEIHGFVSQGYLKSHSYNYLANDSKKGSFQFNEMGVNFSKQVTDNLRIGIQFFSRDLGDAANNKISLDWAYGDYHFKDWLGIRVGKIKIPFGLYNETRDMDMLRTCIVLPQGIYNDLLRDVLIAMQGAGAYGTIPLHKAGSLEYQAMAGVINLDKDNGIGKYVESKFYGSLDVLDDFNTDTSYAASLRWNTPLDGLALKVTTLKYDYDLPVEMSFLGTTIETSVGIKNFLMVYSAEYLLNDLTLAAEYSTTELETSFTLPIYGRITSETKGESYYAMGSYRFKEWLEVGAYYMERYPDKHDKKGHSLKQSSGYGYNFPEYLAWLKDTALFIRFDVNDYFLFKVEGHYLDGVETVMFGDNPNFKDKSWYYFAAKATFSF